MKRIQIIAIASLLASLASAAEPGRTQHHTSPDPIPQGLNAADRSSIHQQMPSIAQQAYLKASNTGAHDEFGRSVAVSGDTLVVGANRESSNGTGVNGNQVDNSASGSGAAYVFVRRGTIWSQQAYLKASNTGTNDRFGWSVAVSGDTVVVGAFEEDSKATGVNGNQRENTDADSGAA
ncbi:MAG: FG-GAP repeat protein [Verrucomicrobia bacterium]|nr:FG-GAP repeat protein [Verrucomicrobiota bacterium]